MTGGHFIWIWADTSSTAEFFQPNSVQMLDEKDQTKTSYEDFVERKLTPAERQYHQAGGNKRPQQNTRNKSLNTSTNRFHQIVGVSADDARSSLKSDKFAGRDALPGQVPIKEKRAGQKFAKNIENDYSGSIESGKSSSLNIKSINSREFNANYYDPHPPTNSFDFDDSTDDENSSLDYDKSNPYQPEIETTTRRSASSASAKANNNKNSNRNNRNNGNNADDELDLENYSEASNDLKAKRADNVASFNISSHVFFHHFKDFPVGLLALRHIKMNTDRIFVRSAVRLFATTWGRVEADEELAAMGGGRKSNWQDSWTANDYGDYDEASQNANKKQKNKSNVNVNSRHNNARGSRKYKRAVQDDEAASISHLVNNRSNSTTKLIHNLSKSHHVSDLSSHNTSDDGIKSNNKTVNDDNTNNSNATRPSGGEVVRELNVQGSIVAQKRNSWWSNIFGGRSQEPRKPKPARLTPQYKGGCFGVPSRTDLKRSELFAR